MLFYIYRFFHILRPDFFRSYDFLCRTGCFEGYLCLCSIQGGGVCGASMFCLREVTLCCRSYIERGVCVGFLKAYVRISL
jgi:hypothetical protein